MWRKQRPGGWEKEIPAGEAHGLMLSMLLEHSFPHARLWGSESQQQHWAALLSEELQPMILGHRLVHREGLGAHGSSDSTWKVCAVVGQT